MVLKVKLSEFYLFKAVIRCLVREKLKYFTYILKICSHHNRMGCNSILTLTT